jgi:arylsulfatase A-like enzyme
LHKPNILIIHADQHRYDCLGAAGNKDIQTPNIDNLAEDGVLFENSFCPHPVCTPSRYSMLSGQYIHQHRCLTNRSTLSPDIPALPELLRAAGYKTTAVGKMHFTPTYLDVGFDEMYLAEQCGDGRYEDDYHRWLRSEGVCDGIDMIDQVREFRDGAPEAYWENFGASSSDLDEKHHSTTWVGDKTLECLDSWDESGNFLMTGFIKPHHPFDPPKPWSDMYNPESLEILPGWTEELIHGDNGESFFSYKDLSESALRQVMSLYYATISQIDFQIGKMIALLKEKGLYENTVIVYTSDHGDYMGYHHRLLKNYLMLEPLMRVPLIIKYTSESQLQGKDQRLVNNIDIAPTILSAAGLTPPQTMAGLNLLDKDVSSDYVFAEKKDEYMVRSKTKKLLLRKNANESMFFDLEKDPLEFENLFNDEGCQEDIAALRSQLQDWPLFDENVTNHLDYDAPTCKGDNVPDGDTGLYSYFKTYMNENKPPTFSSVYK